MTAETLSNDPLTTGATHGLSHTLKVWHRKYEIAANVEDGDIFELGYLPKNAVVCGGWVAADDIDTGTEALDIDVGWAANGGGSATYTDAETGVTYTNAGANASPSGLANVGVMTGDGSAEIYQAGVSYRAMVFPDPLWFSEKTKVQLEANAAANAFAAGTFGVYILYYVL